MSCVLDWEKLAEIATRASVECVGEVQREQHKRVHECIKVLYGISDRIGMKPDTELDWGVYDD